jgi:hypothetical protein
MWSEYATAGREKGTVGLTERFEFFPCQQHDAKHHTTPHTLPSKASHRNSHMEHGNEYKKEDEWREIRTRTGVVERTV